MYHIAVLSCHCHLAFSQGVVEDGLAFIIRDEDGFLEVFLCGFVLFQPEEAESSHVIKLIHVRHLSAASDFVDGLIEEAQSLFHLTRIDGLFQEDLAFIHVVLDLLEVIHRFLFIDVLVLLLFVNAHFYCTKSNMS